MAIDSILSTALSGLQAATRRANAAAHNVANVSTSGFQAVSVAQTAIVAEAGGRGQGVKAEILAGEGGVNMAHEMIDLIRAETAFRASAKLVEAADDLSREVVDLKA